MDPINQPSDPTPETSPVPQPDVQSQPSMSETPSVDTTPPPSPFPAPAPTPLQPAPFPAAPLPPVGPKKSNTGLIIGIVAGTVVLLVIVVLAILGIVAANSMKSRGATTASGNNLGNSSQAKKANSAEVASSSSDFDVVCDGGSISNAAAYSGKSSAVITSFYQSPRYEDEWSYTSTGYGKPYYVQSSEFAKINTVACLEEVKGSRVAARTCDYPDDGKTVSVKYHSLQYKLTYYEAKTGKKIADGGTINAPATKCPMFIAYDKETLSAYAALDDDALEAAYDTFTAQ